MAGKIKHILPPLLWAGLIFYLSSIPSLKTQFGIGDLYLRKAAHIFMFFVLVMLIAPNWTENKLKTRIAAVLIGMLYAASDEYHQKFVPGRFMTVMDIAINWIGCLWGYVLLTVKGQK